MPVKYGICRRRLIRCVADIIRNNLVCNRVGFRTVTSLNYSRTFLNMGPRKVYSNSLNWIAKAEAYVAKNSDIGPINATGKGSLCYETSKEVFGKADDRSVHRVYNYFRAKARKANKSVAGDDSSNTDDDGLGIHEPAPEPIPKHPHDTLETELEFEEEEEGEEDDDGEWSDLEYTNGMVGGVKISTLHPSRCVR
ncbi:hypothetical protein B566_EDAN012061 [Ephemera danica]|nr:hypothetical protein B566_EDAN012061 [Ephemera danica]